MQIRPVSDLRNKFPEIEELVLREEKEVYLTKNGYGSMVVMSIDKYTRLIEEIDLAKALELRFGNVDVDKELSDTIQKIKDGTMEYLQMQGWQLMEKKKYNIQYSTSFNKGLVEAMDYLSNILNNPNAAGKLIKELEEKVKILTVFPRIFSLQIHNDDLVYKFKIQNYLVFYYIQEDTITICNIFYSKRNLSDLLNSIK